MEPKPCINCNIFFGIPETLNLCSQCYIKETGTNTHRLLVPLKRRQQNAYYICSFVTLNFPYQCYSPFTFVMRVKQMLLPKVKGLTNDHLYRFLLTPQKPYQQALILAESAHYLINLLRSWKIKPNHITEHIIFSHVLDTWNIKKATAPTAYAYYHNDGEVPAPNFSAIRTQTQHNIAKAQMLLK